MFADINGLRIAYTDEGAGLPLLFVHGFPLDRAAWSKQVDAFRSRYRVIAPDLPGFGESEALPAPVSMAKFAEILHSLMLYLVAGPAILVGHSMGGYIALAFARAFPRDLRGLLLVGTKASSDTAEVAAGRLATAEKVRAEGPASVVEAMAPKMLSSAADESMAAAVRGFMAQASPEGIAGALQGMAERPDARPWLPEIRVPTLVLAGSEDAIMPAVESERMAEAIPGARFRAIPGAGHLSPFECPDEFREAMTDWLSWGSEAPRCLQYAGKQSETG